MLVVMPRAYMRISLPGGAARSSPRAMWAQRNADRRLATAETRTPKATSRRSAPRSLAHKARGSTYHNPKPSNPAPAATRTTTRHGRRTDVRAAGASASVGSLVGAVRGPPPTRTGRGAQHVLRTPLRLVVDAGEQLAEHTGGHQLHTDQRQKHTEQQQRAPADRMAEDELVDAEIGQDQQSEAEQREADAAERLHGAMQKAHEKLDPEQVKQDAERAVDAVFGSASCARIVADRHLDDVGTDLGRQRGNETMQLTV